MKFNLRIIVPSLVLALVLTGCQLTLPFVSQKAALQIKTTPKSTVFLNGKHVGETPYTDDTLKPGEVTVKLVPEDNSGTSWEAKVTLVAKIRTVINREFGPTDDQSAGEILSLEPLTKKDATSLAIVSTPDSVVVQLDDQPQGFTPISLDSLSAGEHSLILSTPGYQERKIGIRLEAGHKLTVTVQLARVPLEDVSATEETLPATPSAAKASPTPTPKPKASPTASPSATLQPSVASASASTTTPPYVEILTNPVGFLRVRQEASTASLELAKAYPGQKLPYKGQESNGWYQVEYSTGKTGWVARGTSGEYAKLVQ